MKKLLQTSALLCASALILSGCSSNTDKNNKPIETTEIIEETYAYYGQ